MKHHMKTYGLTMQYNSQTLDYVKCSKCFWP